jgi:hypothetical protein
MKHMRDANLFPAAGYPEAIQRYVMGNAAVFTDFEVGGFTLGRKVGF